VTAVSAPALSPVSVPQRVVYDPAGALPANHTCFPCSIGMHTVPGGADACICCGQGVLAFE
jgi:hypothetical protein